MDSDEDVHLGSLFPQAPSAPNAATRRRRDQSDESYEDDASPKTRALPQKRGRYTLDNLSASHDEDEYDLGSQSSSSECASSGSIDDNPTAIRDSPGSDARHPAEFNYLAFDAARDIAADKQRRALGLGIASALGVDAPSRALSLQTAVDIYMRYLSAGLLLTVSAFVAAAAMRNHKPSCLFRTVAHL